MRSLKVLSMALVAILVSMGVSFAQGADQNEVSAMVVIPVIDVTTNDAETYVAVTNAGTEQIWVHASYINGDEDDDDYCYECDFDFPLTPSETTVLQFSNPSNPANAGNPGGYTRIKSFDLMGELDEGLAQVDRSCFFEKGFMVLTIENPRGTTVQDNWLFADVTVIDPDGWAYSVPGVNIQGGNGGDGDRHFRLDGSEYSLLPRFLATNLYPDSNSSPDADLFLFTLHFDRQEPPLTDCSVTGYDANENPFSSSFQFGCWTQKDLASIDPEFRLGNLGYSGAPDRNGWMFLDCRVDRTEDDGTIDYVAGGVHGAFRQRLSGGDCLNRAIEEDGTIDSCPDSSVVTDEVAWGRLLLQSVSTGAATSLSIEGTPGSLGN